MNLRAIHSTPHRLTLSLEGNLDLAGVKEIENAFLDAVTSQPRSIVVDLSQVAFVASLGLRMLLKAHKHLAPSDHQLILYRPSPITRKILLHAGMESIFSIADTEDEVAAALA